MAVTSCSRSAMRLAAPMIGWTFVALASVLAAPTIEARSRSSVPRDRNGTDRGLRSGAVQEPPVLPLPRMPGSVRLASAAEIDDATGQWRLTAAFRVNAHVPHVLAFYRKALADAGLEVDELAPEDEQGTPVLRGRSDRVQARIDLTTKPGQLETRIWILWHVLRE